jgi:hypothetical protein
MSLLSTLESGLQSGLGAHSILLFQLIYFNADGLRHFVVLPYFSNILSRFHANILKNVFHEYFLLFFISKFWNVPGDRTLKSNI